MIEKLDPYNYGCLKYGDNRAQSYTDVLKKINEIIEVINKLSNK